MLEIEACKHEGAGNDFVVVDGREGAFPEGAEAAPLVRALCDRRRGIGADGVLVLRRPATAGAAFRMEYYNADGGEAGMCGNGARCLARFAHDIGAAPAAFRFDTASGAHTGRIESPAAVAIGFPAMPAAARRIDLAAAGRVWDVDFLDTGVPHAVAWVPDAAAVDIAVAGPAIRRHPEFGPAGANANFAQATGPRSLRLRTFERGVEGETLACGTGAVAAAAAHLLRQGAEGHCEVALVPTGGEELRVRLAIEGGRLQQVELAGPARRVFSARVRVGPRGVEPVG